MCVAVMLVRMDKLSKHHALRTCEVSTVVNVCVLFIYGLAATSIAKIQNEGTIKNFHHRISLEEFN